MSRLLGVAQQRPCENFVLNKASSLARGLKAFYHLDGLTPPVELVQGLNATIDNSSGDLSQAILPEIGCGIQYNTAGTSDDRVDLGSCPASHPLNLGGRTDFCVALWCTNDSVATNDRLIDKSNAGNAAEGWIIFRNSSAQLSFVADGVVLLVVAEPVAAATTPRLIVFQRDAANLCEYYFDGIQVASDTQSGAIPTTTTNTAIGGWNHTTNRMWGGKIFTCAIWHRALSPAEQWSLWNRATRWDLYRTPSIPPAFVAAVAGANPKGPLGHPLHGPLGGPV